MGSSSLHSKMGGREAKGNTTAEVQCPQCNTTYIIMFPKGNLLVEILDVTEKVIQKLCPVIMTFKYANNYPQ